MINKKPAVGDSVRIVKYDQYGTVLEQLKTHLWLVQVGNATLQVKTVDLEVIESPQDKTKEKAEAQKSGGGFTKMASKATISLTLDLRGMRYEEAKERLDQYFDDCLYSGPSIYYYSRFRYGSYSGTCAIILKQNPNVDSFRYGGNEGGMGVTVVILKK